MRSKPPAESKLALLALPVLLTVTACASDRGSIRNDAPEMNREELPIRVTRTGVPILMDVPVIGFLFSRTTTER